ncbi:MAG TPA: hypothetical protein VGQ09_09250 [Chitinophagaceae bacterium]|jgi:hypothetical protein|nr:hypothetical protein [Chitinophagaceae bacterium]
MAKGTKPTELELEHLSFRKNFKILQLSNPNYFGNLKESKFTKVELIAANTFYEELKCVSYNPISQLLNAAILVKQASGYNGGPCTNGSFECVRFYVDYLRNGNWVDEGTASTNVHDLSFQEDLCYNVQLKLNPKKLACCDDLAILPRIRAILSWNSCPPANSPNWTPVWGNTLETNIQIAPSKSLWCLIKHNIKLDELVISKFIENINKLNLPPIPQPDPEPLTPQHLKALYKEKVEDTRIVLKQISDLSNFNTPFAFPENFPIKEFNWIDILDKIKVLQFNTTYEEVKCVALNRELDSLHASVVIKKPTGYLGELCKKGSKEYIAFYMDFGTGYQYMGTSSVTVHDIATIPNDGLWYNVSLPVNLQPHQKEWCQAGKAKVKAILSWNVAPPANNPNYVAAYGDWEECYVEIKPLPGGVKPGKTTVILEKVGGMVVDDINNATGLATTNLAGSLGGALDSPFYGTIELIGHIFFPSPGMSYRFLVTKPGGVEMPLTDTQIITTYTMGAPSSVDTTFNPVPDGWIPYLETPFTNIVAGLLGRYGAFTEGKHTIRIQAKDIFNNIYDDPNGSITILVDAAAPDVHIHIDPAIGGDCADFTKGTDITGTYSMLDAHAGSFAISVTPNKGAIVDVDGTGTSSLSYPGGTLPNGGKSGTFIIHTAGVPKCGYNVRIDAWDRTIVSSHTIGLYNNDIQGFCLREP